MLRFVLDYAEGSDVVGTLIIGRVNPIRVEAAYLDSWLVGLLSCIRAVKAGSSHCEADLVEEATPLVASDAGGELSLRFGDQMTTLGPIDYAVSGIVSAVGELARQHPIQNEALAKEIESSLSSLRIH